MRYESLNYIEYGKQNQETVLLLHGGGLSWWNYREAAKALSSDYHVILPILDGHAGSDADFTSIENQASEIIRLIDTRLGGKVLLLGGLSLGGQTVLEMLAQRKNICQFALIESALVIPSRLTHTMIKPAFGSCFGLIRHQWFSKLQFRSLKIKKELFEDYYRDTCSITKTNMIAFLQANSLYAIKPSIADCGAKAFVLVGQHENHAIKKSAAIIHKAIPGSKMQVLPRMHHGTFSLNHADAYAKAIRQIIADK